MARLLFVLLMLACAPAAVTLATEKQPDTTIAGVVVMLNDEPRAIILISSSGKHVIMPADECATDQQCISEVKQLQDAGKLDGIWLGRHGGTSI